MFSLLLLACGTEPAPVADPPPPVEVAAEVPEPGLPELVLDGSQKWQVDAHTRAVMTELRATLASATVTTAEDAAALSATVQGQLDRLIAGCTMTGAAHDELHVFLLAFLPEVSALKTDPNVHVASRRVEALRAHVAGYDEAFE